MSLRPALALVWVTRTNPLPKLGLGGLARPIDLLPYAPLRRSVVASVATPPLTCIVMKQTPSVREQWQCRETNPGRLLKSLGCGGVNCKVWGRSGARVRRNNRGHVHFARISKPLGN